MNRTSRRLCLGLLLGAGFSGAGLVGCSGSGGSDGDANALGQISLPLTTQGASGVTYRLRDATFVVQSQNSGSAGAGGKSGGSSGGSSGAPGTVVVSSETNPDASSISLSLEEGQYNVLLQPGWRMEKVSTGTSRAEPVEATLRSAASQWVWINPQSTSWVEYNFGIGGHDYWFNGKLNITISVEEMPGAGGEGGAGGASDLPPGAGGQAG